MQVDSLPDGWTSAPLASVTRLSKQKWEPSGETEGRDYLSLEHIEAHTGRLLGVGSSDDVRSAKNVYEAGDVLYGKLRPYLNKVARPDEAGVCSTDILVFKPTEVLDSGYLEALLRSHAVTAFAMSHAKGINLPRVSSKSLGTFEVPIPPLPEQRRIVARLDAIEAHRRAAKEHLGALPERLDQYRQSVLAAAFRGDLTAGWRAQHPDAEPAEALLDRIRAERRRRWEDSHGKSSKKYKEPGRADASDSAELPNGWAWMTLEELTSPDRPLCYGVVQPGSDPGDGIPLVRVQDLLGGSIQTDELRRIALDVDAQYKRSRVQAGDVLVSLVGTIGRVAIVGPEVGYANIARAVGRVSALDGLGEWLACCLQSPQLQDWLALESREVARKTLNLGTLAQALVPVPPPAEMAAAVACVSECLGRQKTIAAATRSASERTDQLRQATLARAFRGELVPTDASLARLGATEATHAGRDRGEDRPPLTLFGATSTD